MNHHKLAARLALGAVLVLVMGLVPAQALASPPTGDAGHSTISVLPTTVSVDVGSATITVVAKDSSGTDTGVGGDIVTLSSDTGSVGTVTDNLDGTYTATIIDTQAEVDTISGTMNGTSISTGDPQVTFTPGAADPAITTITASPTTVSVDLGTSTITVHARDQYDNQLTIGGDAVLLNTNHGNLTPVTDNGDGTYTATLTDTVTRSDTISGTINGSPILGADATVVFTAGAASGTHTTITALPTTVSTDTGTSVITVHAKDQFGNNLIAGGDTVVINSDHGSVGAVTDHANGTYTATLSDTVAETDTLTGTINGQTITTVSPTVTFIPGVASGSTTTITALPTTASVDVGSSTITVQAKDAHGNNLTVSGGTVLLNADHGALGAVTNHGNGTYTATLTDTVARLDTISGTINGLTITSGNATVTFTPGIAAADSTISAASSPVSTDVGSVVITVQAKDAHGNNLTTSGGTVLLNTNHGALGTVTDNGDGTYTATLSDTVARTDTVSGSINGITITSGNAVVVFTPGAVSAANTTITAASSPVSTDVGSVVITVQAKDAHGNNLTASGGLVVLHTDHGSLGVVTDHANGTYTATLSDTITETDTVSGTIASLTITSGDAVVVFTPGAATHFGITGSVSVSAGSLNSYTVTAFDVHNNIDTAYTGSVHFHLDTGTGTLPADYTFTSGVSLDNGVHLFAGVGINSLGSHTLFVADKSNGAITGSLGITVTLGPTAKFSVTATTPQTVGVTFTVTVTAQDLGGNTTPSYTGTVKITSTDKYNILPANYTFVGGDLGVHGFLVKLRTVGPQNVIATDTVTSSITGTSAAIVVQALAATYHPLTPPARILDTRNNTGTVGGALIAHASREFQVTGSGGVPANATAVTGNLTVTQQQTFGFLYLGPNQADNPTSSTLNFPAGDDRANAVTVALSGGGTLWVTYVGLAPGVTTHAIFDVTGYFTPDLSGVKYFPLTPARILDSRNGTGGIAGPFHSNIAQSFTVVGHGGVPSGATAVTGNLTVTAQTTAGYIFAGPIANNHPTTSSLNFPVGDDRANQLTVALGSGKLAITYVGIGSAATAQIIFDVTGYFMTSSGGTRFTPLTPARILDTRNGTGGVTGPFLENSPQTFPARGAGGVPNTATAVTGNLTVTQQATAGYLLLGPVSVTNPLTSTLNFPIGDNRANGVAVALSGSGALWLTYQGVAGGATTHAIFDVSGYFAP